MSKKFFAVFAVILVATFVTVSGCGDLGQNGNDENVSIDGGTQNGAGGLCQKYEYDDNFIIWGTVATQIAFSPNGEWVASKNRQNNNVYWLNLKTNKAPKAGAPELRMEGKISEIAFSPDSKWLVSGDGRGWIWFWDVFRTSPILKKRYSEPPKSVPFWEQSQWTFLVPKSGDVFYAVAQEQKELIAFSWSTRSVVKQIETGKKLGRGAQLSSDEKEMAVVVGNSVNIYSVPDLKLVKSIDFAGIKKSDSQPAGLRAWHSKSQRMIIYGDKGYYMHDLASGRTELWVSHADGGQVIISKDWKLAVRSDNKDVYISRNGGKWEQFYEGKRFPLISFLPERDKIFIVDGMEVYIIEASTGKELQVLKIPPPGTDANTVKMSQDGKWFAISSDREVLYKCKP